MDLTPKITLLRHKLNEIEFLSNLDKLSDEQLITEKHLAAMLQISLSKIQKDRVKGGGIPIRKIGSTVRYQLGDIRQYIENSKHQSTSSYEFKYETYVDIFPSIINEWRIPYAVKNGILTDFFATLENDIDSIIWLTEEDALAIKSKLPNSYKNKFL